MIVLGVSGPIHDTSAALLVDGEIAAAVEEERFTRVKHAYKTPPLESVRYCLKTAGITPADVDVIAYPWSLEKFSTNKWRHAWRWRRDPLYALKILAKTKKRNLRYLAKIQNMLREAGFDLDKTEFDYVDHHTAHASSAYHLSGFKDAGVISIDALGEFNTLMIAEGKDGELRTIKEFYMPDSLGAFYTTMTEFLGFKSNDGEYKLMGMAPFGDHTKYDLSDIISLSKDNDRDFQVHPGYIWARKKDSHEGKLYTKKLLDKLGKPREGDALQEPYIHIAAAVQKATEDITMHLIDRYLGDVLDRTRSLCMAGGVALNVSMNRKILELPLVNNLFVQPAANDSGSSLGAAVYAAHRRGEVIKPMKNAYIGPEYSNDEIKKVLDDEDAKYEYFENIEEVGSQLLANGKILSWFQGRMEFGPRALGNRSILGHPAIEGMSEDINAKIKFREKWRPFCPSILDWAAVDVLGSDHDAPYMTYAYRITEKWAKKIPQVVHVDGTGRPQVVRKENNPRYYRLMELFHKKTDLPVILNTSLNRRGEPVVCSPLDALRMLNGSGLEYLAIGNYLVTKR